MSIVISSIRSRIDICLPRGGKVKTTNVVWKELGTSRSGINAMPFSQTPPHRKLNIKSVDDTTYLVPTKYPLRTTFGGFYLIPEGEAHSVTLINLCRRQNGSPSGKRICTHLRTTEAGRKNATHFVNRPYRTNKAKILTNLRI